LALGATVSFDTAAASPTAIGPITLPAGGELKGVVTLAGAPAGNLTVQVRSGGTGAANRFVNTRTQSDGSYTISLPGGTYARVCAFTQASSCGGVTGAVSAFNVSVTANQSNTLNLSIP